MNNLAKNFSIRSKKSIVIPPIMKVAIVLLFAGLLLGVFSPKPVSANSNFYTSFALYEWNIPYINVAGYCPDGTRLAVYDDEGDRVEYRYRGHSSFWNGNNWRILPQGLKPNTKYHVEVTCKSSKTFQKNYSLEYSGNRLNAKFVSSLCIK